MSLVENCILVVLSVEIFSPDDCFLTYKSKRLHSCKNMFSIGNESTWNLEKLPVKLQFMSEVHSVSSV